VPLEAIVVALPHTSEQFVQLGHHLGVVLDPLNEQVLFISVELKAGAFEDAVKGLLRIRLDDILLVLHQRNQLLQQVEVSVALAQ